MERKILVGCDFSPESELAARQAIEIARRIGGEVVLLHGGDTVEMPTLSEHAATGAREAFAAYRAQLAAALADHRRALSGLRERLAGQGPAVSQAVHDDFPDTAIVDAARDLGADLVVVGTHGRTGLRWFFLGSVAGSVVRHSPVDVLVARGDGAGRGGFHRVLVGTDFSVEAERALERAVELAAEEARIDVVHHLGLDWAALAASGGPVPTLAPPTADRLHRAMLEEARERGARLIEEHVRRGVRITFRAEDGGALPGLVHLLEAQPYDLAALGRSGRRGLHRLGLGSVADAVARRAPCSVLIARQPPAASARPT